MARMRPPTVPETPVPVLGDDDLRRLLAACDGRGYEERRDAAISACSSTVGCAWPS
jgi:integrase